MSANDPGDPMLVQSLPEETDGKSETNVQGSEPSVADTQKDTKNTDDEAPSGGSDSDDVSNKLGVEECHKLDSAGEDEKQPDDGSSQGDNFSKKAKSNTIDSMEGCSDIDRLHKHVTDLQNTLEQEKDNGEHTEEQNHNFVGGSTGSDIAVKENEKKDATSIANKLLERLKDQGKVDENVTGDEKPSTPQKNSIAETLLQRWQDMAEAEIDDDEDDDGNGSTEEELEREQLDLEKSLNESVNKVLPTQKDEHRTRERTYKDDVIDYLNDKDVNAELALEKEYSQNVFSLLKVKDEFGSTEDLDGHDLLPFMNCKSKGSSNDIRNRKLRSRKLSSEKIDSPSNNDPSSSQWSSKADDNSLLGGSHDTGEPMTGVVSDDEVNDASCWPEFEEPEHENDVDFMIDDEDSDKPKRRRKRGRKPKHPIKIKLRKHSTPSFDDADNEDFDVMPKMEPENDPLLEDFSSNFLLPAMKKKRGRPHGSKNKQKDQQDDEIENESEEKPSPTSASLPNVTFHRDNAQCYYCQKVFLTKWKMNKHMSIEHRNNKGGFDCPIPECNSTFQKVTFLIRHHRSHMGKTLMCPICPSKAFYRIDHLKKHVRTHDSWDTDTSCMCSVCGKVLSRPDHLRKHERRHLTETIFSCKFCGRQFTHEWKLERHEASHSTVRAHKCEICHRSFTSHITLKYHVKRHTGEKPYKCSKCSKAFYDEAHLKKHEITHSDKAGFMCSICGVAFRYEHGLRRHERRHELQDENGKYTCKYCDKTFADSWKARRHEQIHGAERVRPYKCATCTKAFFTRGALEVHERIHADLRPYSCEICGKSFRQSQELTAHMRIHTGERPFICATCGQSFTTASNLRRHEKGKHAKEKNHYCVICNKGFHRGTDLRRHHATHTGQKPHSCPQCSMHFTTAYSVRRHLEKAHGKIHDGPKRRRPPPPPPQPRVDLNQTQSDVKAIQEQQTMLHQPQQQQQQQHMEQPQQQQQSDCQQNQNNHSKNNQPQVNQDCKQAEEYKHVAQQPLRGQEVPLIQTQPPPLLTVVPPPPAHDPPPAHAQHMHSSHKHYPVHGDPSVHVPGMHVPSTSHTGQLSSHHITAIPQFHGAPDRPVFPERSHMDRPMFPPHNERDPSRPGFPTPHNPHGHGRDPRPVFPGNERPILSSDQLMERAMRGDGQFFYPLNLIQQAPMHFNMDQLLHMASQSDGNPMSMPHPPNSISQ